VSALVDSRHPPGGQGHLPKPEHPLQEVDAGIVFAGERPLLHPLAPLRDEDPPLLAESQKAERFVGLSIKAIEAWSIRAA